MTDREHSVTDERVETAEADSAAAATSRSARLRATWHRLVEPRADGLPNRRVVAVPLLLLAAIFVGLVGFGVTGTSTGFVHPLISDDADPDLLLGSPQPIRSDEWFVQTSWTISQVEQGLPLLNETFPGGMDASVQHDLPTLDWSTVLRPHLMGFLFLPLDQAMAVKWWLPAFATIAFAFLFTVTLLPRRPVTALALGVAFFFSPFFHWWFLSITFYAPAWALAVMTTVLWCLRSSGRLSRWVLASVTAYLTVALGTGIYVPFIVPVALVALGFGVGAVLMPDGTTFRMRFGRIVPVLVAGAAGATLLAVWLITRWETIVGFTSTVYPGERLQQVGQAGLAGFDALFSGPLSVALERTGGQPFASNSSEASTFLLPGVFLFAAMIWLVVDGIRQRRGTDWISVCLLAAGAVMLAFLFVPGWDPLAHVLLLDRTTYGRMRIGVGLLSLVMLVVVSLRLRERAEAGLPGLPAWVQGVGVVAAAALAVRGVWVVVRHFGVDGIRAEASPVALAAGAAIVALTVVIVWLYGAGAFGRATLLLLLVSLVSAGWVNPLYRGVLDLRETAIAAEMERLNAEQPGDWVGIATTPLPTMLLVETGMPSFNGFQSSPAPEMWDQIDPGGDYEQIWNRLANVSWIAGEGDPSPRNPAPDQIQLTFDSCGAFAQDNVRWVLTEVPLRQDCLTLTSTIEEGPTTMRIYEVEAAG